MKESDRVFLNRVVPQDVTGSGLVALTVSQYDRLLTLARRGAGWNEAIEEAAKVADEKSDPKLYSYGTAKIIANAIRALKRTT